MGQGRPRSPAASVTRRRAIGIFAAAVGLPLIAAGVRGLAPQGRFHNWQGEALGTVATLSLWHPDEARARRMIGHSRREIERLEQIFSLHRAGSELSRLNRFGSVAAPSRELRAVFDLAQRMGALSGGAFDMTVQPLWLLYARHFETAGPDAAGPDQRTLARVVSHIDYRRVTIGRARIAFEAPAMAVTLNGIAQGFITDRVADMLRDSGFEHVVVDLGEVRTLGGHPGGRPWRVGIRNATSPGEVAGTVDIAGEALAVSGGYASRFDAAARHHHIFGPDTGRSATRLLDVAVIGPRATEADALSTAIFAAGEARARTLLAAFAGTRARITRHDGTIAEL
jgi:thiamine biosynthesis lipoprotein